MHDDTPWLTEAIEPIILHVKGHLAGLDEDNQAAVALAIADAAEAGYVQGVAAMTTRTEIKLREEGVKFNLPTLYIGGPE
jgi:hypothetical protein